MRVGLVVVVCGLVGLAGCSGGVLGGSDGASGGASVGAKLMGAVHGGQQPVVGAHVYLFAAGTTGYGGAGIAASSGNASVSLLTSAGNTALDSSGGATNGDYYVTTDSGGGFSISGDYTCAAGSQVYLYALGGNPGAGVNSAAGLMAVLGSCPAAGNFAAATPFVMVNEVSTIAAAYAMAGFATDATHVGSSGTQLALTGIANAGNLVTLSTGAALATTPAGNGTVPQAEINTLANVLAACVNSNGAGSTACSTLFANAMSGGSSGTVAGDTATAAINVAHNPGVNVASLYGLASGTPPFAPGLSAVPNDFTVAISFTGYGIFYGHGIAIDGTGNAWLTSNKGTLGADSVVELSSLGAPLSGPNGYTGGGLAGPISIAIDQSGNAWIVGNTPGLRAVEISSTGQFLSGTIGFQDLNVPFGIGGSVGVGIDGVGNVWVPGDGSVSSIGVFSNAGVLFDLLDQPFEYGLSGPRGVAIDTSGNAWILEPYSNQVTAFQPASNSPYEFVEPSLVGLYGPGGGLNGPTGVAIDSANNVWIANGAGNSLVKMSNAGAFLSGVGGFTGGGLSSPDCIAIDGAGNAWAGEYTSMNVVEFSNAGAVLSGAGGYSGTSRNYVFAIAIDGSGDVWTTNQGNSVSEIIGASVPVVTPLSVGVKNKMLGTRP